jgi:hypothetical protein
MKRTLSFLLVTLLLASLIPAGSLAVETLTPTPGPEILVETAATATTYTYLGYSSIYSKQAQSLKAADTGISQVTVALARKGTPARNIQVRVRSVLGGADLATGIITPSQVTSTDYQAPSWVTVPLTRNQDITKGSTIFVLLVMDGYDYRNCYLVPLNRNNQYNDGSHYQNTVGSMNYNYDMLVRALFTSGTAAETPKPTPTVTPTPTPTVTLTPTPTATPTATPTPSWNPVPVLTGLTPSSTAAGGSAFTLTVRGSGFVPASRVVWGTVYRPTTYVSPTELTARISASDLISSGTKWVSVSTPSPGGGRSSNRAFTITKAATPTPTPTPTPVPNPVPVISSLSPSTATAGGTAFTLMVAGTGFVPSSKVRWNGQDRTTTHVSSMTLTASIPASDIAMQGTRTVEVFTAPPGGGLSGTRTFPIGAPVTPTPTETPKPTQTPTPTPTPTPTVIPTPTPTGTPPPVTGFALGSAWLGNENVSSWATVKDAGAQWARIRVFYTGTDVSGLSNWWAWPDDQIRKAEQSGYRVILLAWWWPGGAPSQHGDMTTASVADSNAFWSAIAQHYRGRGLTYQIENEPDMAPTTFPKLDQWPERVLGAAEAIKAADPQARVIAPALAYEPSAGAHSEKTHYQQVFSNSSCKVDAAALHAYMDFNTRWSGGLTGKVNTFRQDIRVYRNGAYYTPSVWITEGGIASAPTDQWNTRSETLQALGMTSWIQQMRAANVPVAIIYRAQDQSGDPMKWGLLREDGSAKPALAVLRTA